MHLENATLDLLSGSGVVALPEQNGREAQDCNGSRGDEHDSLRVSVPDLDGGPGRRTDRVQELLGELSVNKCCIACSLRWKKSGKIVVECSGPDGSSDGTTDRTTNGIAHSQNCQYNGNVLMRDGGHDSDLLSNHESATTKGDEELAHNNVANVDAGLSEDNHQCNSEQSQRHSKEEALPLEVACISDDETGNESPEAGSHTVDVQDVSNAHEVQVNNGLEEGGEVGIPDVELNKEDRGDDETSDNGSVLHQFPGNDGDRRELPFPDCECNKCNETNDDHGYDQRGRPLLVQCVSLVRIQAEREEEDGQSANEEE